MHGGNDLARSSCLLHIPTLAFPPSSGKSGMLLMPHAVTSHSLLDGSTEPIPPRASSQFLSSPGDHHCPPRPWGVTVHSGLLPRARPSFRTALRVSAAASLNSRPLVPLLPQHFQCWCPRELCPTSLNSTHISDIYSKGPEPGI